MRPDPIFEVAKGVGLTRAKFDACLDGGSKKALVDAAQALTLEELPWFLEDMAIAREAYLVRREVAQRHAGQ